MIDRNLTENDALDWKCIHEIRASAPFDLEERTFETFRRLRDRRPELAEILDAFSSDPDFSDVDLNSLLGSSI